MMPSWTLIASWLPQLMVAAGQTLKMAAFSYVVGIVVGLIIAIAEMSEHRVLSKACRVYIEFVRATPILTQLFLIYFVLPSVGIALPEFTAAVIALGLHYAAYMAETYRSGIAGVPAAQREAAQAIGMTSRRDAALHHSAAVGSDHPATDGKLGDLTAEGHFGRIIDCRARADAARQRPDRRILYADAALHHCRDLLFRDGLSAIALGTVPRAACAARICVCAQGFAIIGPYGCGSVSECSVQRLRHTGLVSRIKEATHDQTNHAAGTIYPWLWLSSRSLASHRAVREMKADGELPADTKLPSSKYLNNLIEQDHRGMKLRIGPMLGFKWLRVAAITIAGIELLRRIHKCVGSTRGNSTSAGCTSKIEARPPSGTRCWPRNKTGTSGDLRWLRRKLHQSHHPQVLDGLTGERRT